MFLNVPFLWSKKWGVVSSAVIDIQDTKAVYDARPNRGDKVDAEGAIICYHDIYLVKL